jgi:DNA-binding NtrC family response regulator
MAIKVLVTDDEVGICVALETLFTAEGYTVYTAYTGQSALSLIYEHDFDLVFTDLRLPDMNGLDIIKHVKLRAPAPQIILITGFASIETAVEAIRNGAYDYLTKPLSPEKVRITAKRALEKLALTKELNRLKGEMSQCYSFDNFIGKSLKTQEVLNTLRYAARSNSNILVTGESGTGKEIVAREIHYNSMRKELPFVPVNCAAIAKDLIESELFGYVKGAFTGAIRDKVGFLEAASGGTLFLDEIGETSPSFQVKLLRVLQQGEFYKVGDVRPTKIDIRVIAATNRDLKKAMIEGDFREDLFYRLNVIPISLPPLRHRREDIPLLAIHFLQKHIKKFPDKKVAEITPEAMELLVHYDFPGNVRELENAVEYAIVFAHGLQITPRELPLSIMSQIRSAAINSEQQHIADIKHKPLKSAKYEFERSFITNVLRDCKSNISLAARTLQIHRQSLQQKIRELSIRIDSLK